MEFPISNSNSNIIRVFVNYWADYENQVLESFDLDLDSKLVSNIDKRGINGVMRSLGPTAFLL